MEIDNSDRGHFRWAIPTLLKSIDWPKESIMKLIVEFEKYRNSGPWEIGDEFLTKILEVVNVGSRWKKFD